MATDFSAFQSYLVADVGGLGGPKAQMWFGFTGRYKDAELDLLRQWKAVERFPDECGEDALPYVASTFDLARLDDETAAEWRFRLQDAWAFHKLTGSGPSVDALLLASGSTAVSYVEQWEVDDTDPFYTKTIWGVDEPGFTVTTFPTTLPFILGSTITLARIRGIVGIILKYRSAHCIPVSVEIQDGIGGYIVLPIFDVLGSSTFTLPFRLGAPVEY
jgi:hypothetical protein